MNDLVDNQYYWVITHKGTAPEPVIYVELRDTFYGIDGSYTSVYKILKPLNYDD